MIHGGKVLKSKKQKKSYNYGIMSENLERKDENNLCEICQKDISKYTCPKCGIEYCSLNCYKSENHSECSESFYKQCVEEELRLDEKDPETRRKMLEILKRMHEEQEYDIEEIEELARRGLDSDDEDEDPDLSERLENIDLDDADSVWAVLTDSEKQDFEALLRNGDVENLLPLWKPWWSYRAENKLVEDLSRTAETFDYRKNCPMIKEVKPFDQISKVPPADCVKNNVSNVLHAYVFTVLYFNGDHHDFAREAVSVLLQLSNNLKKNEVFPEPNLAIESVCQQALNCPSLIGDAETLSATKSASICILGGPEDSNKCYYLKAALSDVHLLLSEAKVLNKRKDVSKNDKKEFSKRFPDHGAISTLELPTDKLRLYTKKIEFYLSWIESYGKDLYT